MAYMKALRYFSKKKQVELVDLPAPSNPEADNVIIRVSFSGVCGSDLHVIAGDFPVAEQVTLGHEFSGIIHAVGPGVDNLYPGDRVAVDPNSGCGHCFYCKQGHYNYCTTGGLRSTIGLYREGGWAEFCVVPSNQVFKIPANLPLKQAILCEPMSCILHGWNRNGPIHQDAKILIMGTGIIGLLWACLFHKRGYSDVTISEINKNRQEVANNLNLGYRVTHPEELQEFFQQNEPEIKGFDVVVDCTGNPQAMQKAFQWLKRGGLLNVFGCCAPGEEVKFQASDIMIKEITLIGTLINPFTYQDAVKLVQDMEQEYFDFDRLGIKCFNLCDFENAFEDLRKGTISKAVFIVGGP